MGFAKYNEKFIVYCYCIIPYSATNMICAALTVVLAICALTFEIGFLPSFAVCLIWMVNQSVFFKEAIAHSKAGRRIS